MNTKRSLNQAPELDPVHMVRRDILDKGDIEAIGRRYADVLKNGKASEYELGMMDFLPYVAWITLESAWQMHFGKYMWVDDAEPYATTEQMREEFDASGVLKISTQFNNPVAGISKNMNLFFRFLHDMHHIQSNCNFNLDGEICMAAKAAETMIAWVRGGSLNDGTISEEDLPMMIRMVFSEIVGQVCYLRYSGEFGDQVLVRIPDNVINWVLRAYKVDYQL
jgi:hypothetical protein